MPLFIFFISTFLSFEGYPPISGTLVEGVGKALFQVVFFHWKGIQEGASPFLSYQIIMHRTGDSIAESNAGNILIRNILISNRSELEIR